MSLMYGMEFLSVALVVMVILLVHFLRHRRVTNANTRVFTFFVVIGVLDVLFDMISTVLISGDFPQYAETAKIVLTLFYVMQVIIPCAMLCYTQSLRLIPSKRLYMLMINSVIPALFMLAAVIANYWFGYLFYFDEAGNYSRGFLYLITYVYAIAYGFVCFMGSIVHLNELEKGQFQTIMEFMLIEVACVVIQALTGLLTTGLGIALGLLVLYLTINNPSAYTDHMTGVFDKKYFREWMNEQKSREWKVNLFAVELRQLKQVNKTLGTSGGDNLLVQVAEQLQQICETGRVFRTGGNQYVIASTSQAEYERQRTELQNYFNSLFSVNGETLRFPAVICGILDAGKLDPNDDLEGYIEYLVNQAPAMDELVIIQDDAQTMEGFRYEKEIERYLNTAVDQDLFQVHYQPVYSLQTNGFITLEALSRLTHPTFGPVSPEVFIGIAERNGRIAELGELQLRRVCRFVSEHRELLEKLNNVKFNLSPAELLRPGHSQKLISIIKEYDIPPSFIQFEITENVATEYSKRLYRLIENFRREGIGLCLDDFGSGYSNLNAVLKLPFSCIKLDRSLLRGVCTDPMVSKFYRSIVSVLQSLGYKIISEGVEEKAEVELLSSWGVDMIQGYYFSKPLTEADTLKKILE